MLSMLFLSLISQICILLLHAFWWFYISITFDFLFVFLQSNPFVVYFFAGFNFWTRRTKRKLELIFWKMEASIKISVWTGLEGEKTEPNQN
jgi:hypothetical protein